MAELVDFLSLVRGKLPGCPELLMEEAVRESAIEFCRRTQLLTDDATITTVAAQRFYDMYPPEGVAYIINNVLRDDDPLIPSSRHDFEAEGLDVESGSPTDYYIEGDGRLVLGPIPDAIESLTVKVVIEPESTAEIIADALYRDHRRAIAAGARAYVRQNYFEWVNDQEEAKDRALFEDAIGKANLRRAKGGGKKRLRTRAQFF